MHPEVISLSLDIVSDMLIQIADHPCSIIGFLYVMEGSLNGSEQIKNQIEIRLLRNDVTHYLKAYGSDAKNKWKEFGSIIDSEKFDDEEKSVIIRSSLQLFRGLNSLFQSISGIKDPDAQYHITSVNPEAGNHPMPSNPLEISAALRAGVKAWAEFPYLKLRFGERGLRFAKSDSCWLATLPQLFQTEIDNQIVWLARLLTNRGIPSAILRFHLVVLVKELSESNPEGKTTYQKLNAAANSLHEAQRKILPDEKFAGIAEEMHLKLAELIDLPANSGIALLSAFLDEQNGLGNANNVIVSWFREEFISDQISRETFDKVIQDAFRLVGERKV